MCEVPVATKSSGPSKRTALTDHVRVQLADYSRSERFQLIRSPSVVLELEEEDPDL